MGNQAAAVGVMLAQALKNIGIGLARTVDPVWEFSDEECQAEAAAISACLPELNDPWTILALTTAGMVGPRLAVTFVNAQERKRAAPPRPAVMQEEPPPKETRQAAPPPEPSRPDGGWIDPAHLS